MAISFSHLDKKTWIKIGLTLFLLGFFAIPAYSFAAGTDGTPGNFISKPLYLLLKDDEVLHAFWKDMMTLVNSFVVLLLIAVAFAEILNINISTYGVKKILPALVLAVIAANFSWIMCRLFIDWANIVMSRFGGDTSIIDPLISSREPFNISLTNINTANSSANILNGVGGGEISFFQAFMKTLFVWVGAIALYILTFLLLLRNIIIVGLAVFSPVAFMAMVLPQTKSAFNKWWTTFIQWTFMPTVAVFMLWMGSKVQNSISGSDPLIGFLIAIGFIYGAIKVPFSMSGAASGIMNKWADMGKKSAKFVGNAAYQYSGAKSAVDYQKELIKTRADVTKTKVANKLKDLTGIGSGLDIQKDKLARAQKRSKSISDKKVGEYIGKRGKNDKDGEMTGREKRYAMEEAETMANDGTTEYANKKLLSGLAKEAENKTPLGKKVEKMRMGSQKAGYEMAAMDKDWSKLNDDMKIALMKGTTHEGENIEDAIKTGKWAKSGKAITEEERKNGQAQLDFLKQYSKSVLDGDLTALSAKSAEGKVVQKVADERISIDNAASAYILAEKMDKALRVNNELEAKISAGNALTADETTALAENTTALKEAGYDMSSPANRAISTAKLINDFTVAKKDYDGKIAQLNKDYAKPGAAGATMNDIPAFLQQYAKFDSNGLLNGLAELSSDDRKQIQKMVQTKISSGAAEDADNFGTEQLKEYIKTGKKGEWSKQDFENWVTGNSSRNSGTANRKLITALEALGANIVTGMKATVGASGEAMRAKIETYYAGGLGLARMKKMAEQINKGMGNKTIIDAGSNDINLIKRQIDLVMAGGAAAATHLTSRGVDNTKNNAVNTAQSAIADTLKKPEGLKGGKKNRTVSET